MDQDSARRSGDAAERARPAAAAELSGVYKAFVASGSKQASLALEDISLTVADREFCAIVGPSGCGKSTILNLLAGLTFPTEGNVVFRGAPVKGVNTGAGYVTQEDNLLPWRTLLANVELPLELQGIPVARRRTRAEEIIRRLGLGGFETHYPRELSGGMRKRAAIARTLVRDSSVILMDEPFGSLDAQTRNLLQADLMRLWESSPRTIVFVTHDLAEAIVLADRVVVMSASPGRVKRTYDVPIPRPRDAFHVHRLPGFADVYDQIWADIRDEITGAAWT